MTPENFAYWLKSCFEVAGMKSFDETQTRIIKDHLDLVFKKVTPTVLRDVKPYPLPEWLPGPYTPEYDPAKFTPMCAGDAARTPEEEIFCMTHHQASC